MSNVEMTKDTTNSRWINVGTLAGKVQRIDFIDGMTARMALELAGKDANDFSALSVNGAPCTLDFALEPNTTILLTVAPSNG